MTWNAHNFSRSLEGGILGIAIAAGNAAAVRRAHDAADADAASAVGHLASALRRERRRNAELEQLAVALYDRLRLAEDALEAIRDLR